MSNACLKVIKATKGAQISRNSMLEGKELQKNEAKIPLTVCHVGILIFSRQTRDGGRGNPAEKTAGKRRSRAALHFTSAAVDVEVGIPGEPR